MRFALRKVSDRIATSSENISIENYCDLNQPSWLKGTTDLLAGGANLSSAQSAQVLSLRQSRRRLKTMSLMPSRQWMGKRSEPCN